MVPSFVESCHPKLGVGPCHFPAGGTQLALCNPVMLVMVAFVLWASLLHVTMEEEKELFDEFPGKCC